MKSIQIVQLNYFSSLQSNNDYNGKVLYSKNGKLYLAHVYVDFFNKSIYNAKQPKECKVLGGLFNVLNDWASKNYF